MLALRTVLFPSLIVLGLLLRPTAADIAAYRTALDMVPEGAEMVIVVPSLESANEGVMAMRDRANLAGYEPFRGDLLERLLEAGEVEGVDRDGPIVAALPSMAEMAEQMEAMNEVQTWLLVPVSDYEAFVRTMVREFRDEAVLEPEGDEEPLPDVAMPDDASQPLEVRLDGSRVVLQKVGDHAVMHWPNERGVPTPYQAGGKGDDWLELIGPSGRNVLETADAAVLMNIAAMAPAARPLLEQGRAQVMANLDRNEQMMRARGMDTTQITQTRPIMAAYFDAGQAILNDSDAMVVALDVSEAGATLAIATQVKAETPLGRTLAGREAKDLSTLYAGVPDVRPAGLLALDTESVDLLPFFELMLRFNPQTAAGEGGGLMEMQRRSFEMMRQTTGTVMAVYPPAADAADGGEEEATLASWMRAVVVYQTPDPEVFQDEMQRIYESVGAFDMPLTPDPNGPKARAVVTYLPDAERVAGREVDRMMYRVEMNADDARLTPQQRAVVEMQREMFRMSEYDGYIAAGDERVWLTPTQDAKLLEQAFEAKAAELPDSVAERVRAMREGVMPPGLISEGYVFVPEAMEVAMPILRRVVEGDGRAFEGSPPAAAIRAAGDPGEGAVLAMGVGGEGSGLVVTLHASSEAVGYFVRMGMGGEEDQAVEREAMDVASLRAERVSRERELAEIARRSAEQNERLVRLQEDRIEANRRIVELREAAVAEGRGDDPELLQAEEIVAALASELKAIQARLVEINEKQILLEQHLQLVRQREAELGVLRGDRVAPERSAVPEAVRPMSPEEERRRQEQIGALRAQLQLMQGQFSGRHPSVEAIKYRIRALEAGGDVDRGAQASDERAAAELEMLQRRQGIEAERRRQLEAEEAAAVADEATPR